LLEALPTKDWPTLRRFEGNGRLLAASGATGTCFYFRVIARRRCAQGGRPLGLAGFATFGFVFELLIVEEQLLSCCEHKIRTAVDTLENLILEFHGELLPSARDPEAPDGVTCSRQQNRTERSDWQSQIPELRTSPWVRPTMRNRMALLVKLQFCSMKFRCSYKSEGPPSERRPTSELVLLLTSFFAAALARQRFFHTLLFARLEVEGMTLHFLDDVLLLDLTLEAAQSVF
jgi:hypothetical protein